jgi:hypothetical protein
MLRVPLFYRITVKKTSGINIALKQCTCMWLSDTLLLMYNVYYIYQFESFIYKKELKILKGQSESAYRRRIDNRMAKKKKYKGTNNDQQNVHIKLKIE